MTRIINIDKEYKMNPNKAINKFFKTHPELDYWKETFEYMADKGVNHFVDDLFADGTKNENWTYSLWLDINGDYTYIAVIERA